ncbi:heme-binding protein [Streptomyces sp. NPDC002586]
MEDVVLPFQTSLGMEVTASFRRQRIVAAVYTAAARIGFPAAVAVTDPGGRLKALDRADGAQPPGGRSPASDGGIKRAADGAR